MEKNVHEAAAFIESKLDHSPETGVITGTGLGDAVGSLGELTFIEYEDIPHFPISTVIGHSGRLFTGTMNGHGIIFMQGRFHLYEGYSPKEVTFPIRVMKELGVNNLILSNAAGGMNHNFNQGDLMVIKDHINLTGENPLVGANIDYWGPRFPDMTSAYDLSLIKLAQQAAVQSGFSLVKGVYAGLKGPCLETPAEVRYLKTIGADAVGFSTVMETIAAVHAGMRVVGLSTITNTIDPHRPEPASLEAIIATANQTAPRLGRLIETLVTQIHKDIS